MNPNVWARMAREGFATMRQRNVLRPLLALDVTFTPLCFLLTSFGHVFQTAFFVAGCCPVALTLLGYGYWTFADADRLHDEEFQLRSREQRSISPLLAKSGTISDPSELTAVEAPFHVLPADTGGAQQ